jgi:hypothetical protein
MIVNEISLVIQNIKIEFQLYVYKRIFLLNVQASMKENKEKKIKN